MNRLTIILAGPRWSSSVGSAPVSQVKAIRKAACTQVGRIEATAAIVEEPLHPTTPCSTRAWVYGCTFSRATFLVTTASTCWRLT